MRRVVILASIMVFFDVAFFAAIAPLLPDYASQFELSEAGAGVLAASYGAGTLLASLPAGFVATRFGPRRTVIGGLLLLGVSSVVFGFAGQIVLLDSARFVQGIAGALIWSGALTWLITTTPPERRGAVIGAALGMAVAGALVGPLLGAIAAAVGTELVFSAVLGGAIALAVFAFRLPEGETPERQSLRRIAMTILSRPILAATAFVAVPSLMFGAVEVLVPLRIDDLGGSTAIIAGGFIAGAGIEGTLAPIAGRYSDRVGRRRPFVVGMSICAAGMVGLAFAQGVGLVVLALIVSSLGAGIGFTPAVTSFSEAADSTQLQQGFAAGLSNMAWSAGQVIGSLAGGGIASAAGYAAPSLVVALLLAFTAAYAFRALAAPAAQPT